MRKNGINKISAKYQRLILDRASWPRTFTKLANRRDTRTAVVSRLHRLLEDGSHFETPLVANRLNGTYRLLDGNHRGEAIERYFANHPERKVEVVVFYYENLNPDEEKNFTRNGTWGQNRTPMILSSSIGMRYHL